jgi:hypothetical protein
VPEDLRRKRDGRARDRLPHPSSALGILEHVPDMIKYMLVWPYIVADRLAGALREMKKRRR